MARKQYGRNVVLESSISQVNATALAKGMAVVEQSAFQIEAGAKMRSRVDTGRMRAGWKTRPDGPFDRIVYDNVEYTIFHEFGTRTMPGQPMLIPSVEAVRPSFEAAMRRVFG